MIAQPSPKLTNLQLELVKIFSYKVTENQLLDIKNMLGNYFAQQATEEMDRLWEENNWTNEHLRMN